MRVAQVKLEKRHIVLRCDTKEENFSVGDLVVVETNWGWRRAGGECGSRGGRDGWG